MARISKFGGPARFLQKPPEIDFVPAMSALASDGTDISWTSRTGDFISIPHWGGTVAKLSIPGIGSEQVFVASNEAFYFARAIPGQEQLASASKAGDVRVLARFHSIPGGRIGQRVGGVVLPGRRVGDMQLGFLDYDFDGLLTFHAAPLGDLLGVPPSGNGAKIAWCNTDQLTLLSRETGELERPPLVGCSVVSNFIGDRFVVAHLGGISAVRVSATTTIKSVMVGTRYAPHSILIDGECVYVMAVDTRASEQSVILRASLP